MTDRERSIDWTFAESARPMPRRLVLLFAMLAGTLVAFGIWHVRSANERERRERCAVNLRQIGEAILLYANEHRNRYPDSFATLARSPQAIAPATFACPATDDRMPTSTDAGAGSYRLVADTMPTPMKMFGPDRSRFAMGSLVAEECVAIETPGRHRDGVHVLLADGHVEFRPVAEVRGATWSDVQDDVIKNRPIRWPASQPTR